MNKGTFKVGLLSCLFLVGAAGVMEQPTVTTAQLNEQEETKFYEELQSGIKKSQDQYTKLKGAINPANATDDERKAIMNVATALEVKYTLYKNFYNTPSVQSPAVRGELQKLFQKNFITLDDLTQLKKTVSAERAKMGLPANPSATSTK